MESRVGTPRTVLVGCPVRRRAWVLPTYLAHVDALEAPPGVRVLCHFVVQPDGDSTEEIVASWCAVRPWASWGRVTGAPAGWCRDAGASRYDYHWLAAVRNVLADQALAAGADLLSVDSDILLGRDHLVRLDRARLPIVAGVVSNSPDRALVAGMRNYEAASPRLDRAALAGLAPVVWTGACVLIRREVLAAGVRWAFDPRGEDVAFCARARALGFPPYVNGGIRPLHVMRPADLPRP
ncbi:MAG: hypothetical protein ACYCW6_25655 [Candidatus Xenobia bacterium]